MKPPTYTGHRYLAALVLTAILLAVPIVMAVCVGPISPDQPAALPTPTIPPATPLPTPAPSATAYVIVPTQVPLWTLPPTETVVPATQTPDVLPVLINTPAPTVTPLFRPRPPVQIPHQGG